MREILGWLLRTGPAQLVFVYGDHGKPRLAAQVAERLLYFNVAHSDALAVYAVSAYHDVGVDIERIRPIREAEEIGARFFSERENAEWRSLPAGRQMEAFFNCWTSKEALVKAAGSGLGGPLNQTEVPLNSGKPAWLLNTAGTATVCSNFSLHSLAPARGYIGAAATKNAGMPYCWQWPAQLTS